MFISFDSETLGLPYPDLPLTHWKQPRIVQLSAILFDETGHEEEVLDTLIYPDGWTVDYDSEQVHGWTTEDCQLVGIPMAEALDAFDAMVEKAEIIAAHHIDFDMKMLEIECALIGRSFKRWENQFCTMKAAAPIVGIPYGRGRFKYPSLEEAVNGVLGKEVDEDVLHDAQNDARFCKDIFLELMRRQGRI